MALLTTTRIPFSYMYKVSFFNQETVNTHKVWFHFLFWDQEVGVLLYAYTKYFFLASQIKPHILHTLWNSFNIPCIYIASFGRGIIFILKAHIKGFDTTEDVFAFPYIPPPFVICRRYRLYTLFLQFAQTFSLCLCLRSLFLNGVFSLYYTPQTFIQKTPCCKKILSFGILCIDNIIFCLCHCVYGCLFTYCCLW